jgi:hypothetical protein
MPLLRVPHSSSAPSLTISMAGGYMSMPPPHVSSLRVCRDEISTIRRRIATGAYYTLVHICRQPARLGEIMAVRPDERRHGSPCDARGVGRSRDGCGYYAWCTGGTAMRTLMESLKLLLAKIRKLVTGQR